MQFSLASPSGRAAAVLDSVNVFESIEWDDSPGEFVWAAPKTFPCAEPSELPMGDVQAGRLGTKLVAQGRFAEALPFFAAVRRQTKTGYHKAFYVETAEALWHTGKVDSARAVLVDVARDVGKDIFVGTTRASIQYTLDRLRAARDKLAPPDQVAWSVAIARAEDALRKATR
jgi:hypothetical protein